MGCLLSNTVPLPILFFELLASSPHKNHIIEGFSTLRNFVTLEVNPRQIPLWLPGLFSSQVRYLFNSNTPCSSQLLNSSSGLAIQKEPLRISSLIPENDGGYERSVLFDRCGGREWSGDWRGLDD